MTVENWIAVVGAAISLCAFLLSAWQARQSAKSSRDSQASAEESLAQAERSASAAEEASASQRRIADALEKMGSKYSMPWVVANLGAGEFTLLNDSDEPALDVKLSHDSPLGPNTFEAKRLGPGESLQFNFFGAAPSKRRMSVQWTRPSEDEPRVWAALIPRSTKQ
ncbi:hypothetical protein [Corynebacterium phoceense]